MHHAIVEMSGDPQRVLRKDKNRSRQHWRASPDVSAALAAAPLGVRRQPALQTAAQAAFLMRGCGCCHTAQQAEAGSKAGVAVTPGQGGGVELRCCSRLPKEAAVRADLFSNVTNGVDTEGRKHLHQRLSSEGRGRHVG